MRISTQKGFALLAYLAMSPGRPISRSVLSDLLWGDRGEAQARQSLRQTILTLRRDLGPVFGAMLRVDDHAIALAPEAIDVDVLRFEGWAADPSLEVRLQCLQVPWAPFLDRFSVNSEGFDQWVRDQRHRLEALATRVFADLAAQFVAVGDDESAILAFEYLIAIDPAEEERHRRLLTLEARSRSPDAALARAKSLAAMLKRDFDVEPEAATVALVREIRRQAQEHGRQVPLAVPAAPASRPDAPSTTPTSAVAPQGAAHRRRLPALAVAASVLFFGVVALAAVEWLNRQPQSSNRTADIGAAELRLRKSIDPWQSPPLPVRSATLVPTTSENGLVSIAVLPFKTYEGDTQQANLLGEMTTDELNSLLSRIPMFRVIARQTSMSYRGQAVDAATIGAALGVRYLLDGTISFRGNMLRINTELIETKSQLHVWSARFERPQGDHGVIVDEITRSLARELHIEVGQFESLYPSKDSAVHQAVFKGWAAFDAVPREKLKALQRAEAHFGAALAREPDNVSARHGMAAYHIQMGAQGFSSDMEAELSKAEAILKQLAEIKPNSFGISYWMGVIHIARNQNDAALRSFERSLGLNPSHAPSYAQIGRALVRLGRPLEGIEHIRYATRLSPRDPALPYWLGYAGYAEVELHRYRDAVTTLEKALALDPGQPRTMLTLVAAHAMNGDLDKARELIAELQRQRPHMTNDRIVANLRKRPDAETSPISHGILKALGVEMD